MTLLLQGVGGSVAHGLAGPESDQDRYGVYAAPTLDLVVPWSTPAPSSKRPADGSDGAVYEAGKYASLLAVCNPTVMELLWLPEHLYEVMTGYGQALIDLRTDVLCASKIRAVYGGFITGQIRRLQREDLLAADRKRQAAKLVRHGLRVAEQGVTLLRTGALVVQPGDPQRFRRYDDDPHDGVDDLVRVRNEMDHTPAGVLPEELPAGALDGLREWVRSVRLAHLT